jgi:O-antigen ligase
MLNALLPLLSSFLSFSKSALRLRTVLSLLLVSGIGFVAMRFAGTALVTRDGILLVVVAALLIMLFYATLARSGASETRSSLLNLALCAWFVLLISEKIFAHTGSDESALQDRFAPEAYGEATAWFLVFVAMLFILAKRPSYIFPKFIGSCKLLSLFAGMCVVSVMYSSKITYSLAWSFKLCVVVLMLQVVSLEIRTLEDVRRLFTANAFGFLLLTVFPLIQACLDPGNAFEGGRLRDEFSPTAMSATAASLVLLSMVLNALSRRKWLIGIGAIGAFTMLFGGGKAGIIAGIFSTILFFMLQKKMGSAILFVAATVVVATGLLLATPLSSYFSEYQRAGQLSTITGRTDLWTAALPEILRRPIFGHGYMSSKFVSIEFGLEGSFADAGHLHNGFLEVFYNNGLIGFIILLLMHVAILRGFLGTLKRRGPKDPAYVIAAGSLALYMNLLINGFFNVSFGGRPDSSFMLFMSLLVVAEVLRRHRVRRSDVSQLSNEAEGSARRRQIIQPPSSATFPAG